MSYDFIEGHAIRAAKRLEKALELYNATAIQQESAYLNQGEYPFTPFPLNDMGFRTYLDNLKAYGELQVVMMRYQAARAELNAALGGPK